MRFLIRAGLLFLLVSGLRAEEGVDIAKARLKGREPLFQWVTWSDEAFARAKREHRFILLDCAAEWCHWCHVMDATTYLDPEIGKTLHDQFVTIRVDIDNRPDLAERYGEWGWPATVIFSPDVEELGKFRGYLPPEEFRPILQDIQKAAVTTVKSTPDPAAPLDALLWIGVRMTADFDEWYDAEEGGWGHRQKAPLGANAEFEWRRASHGDSNAWQRASYTLSQQLALMDPVWGGFYQYSAATNWKSPHFEKLLTFQAANLEAYARAYAVTGDSKWLDAAKKLDGYLTNFLTSTNGTFFATQDADLNAHEKDKPFVDGHTYYALDNASRRKLGIPRIDTAVYSRENGLAVAALCTLYEATHDPTVLDRARRAADAILVSHVTTNGLVRHEERRKTGPYFLADQAGFGWGLARLAEASGNAEYRQRAVQMGEALMKEFADPEPGGLWEHTPDANAIGVFAKRQRPFVHNVVAARFLAALGWITGDKVWQERAQRVLASASTPGQLKDQGRMLGEFLLALDESGRYLW